MLKKEQIEIADIILKFIDSAGGQTMTGDYNEKLREKGFKNYDSKIVFDILIKDFELLEYANNQNFRIRLKPNGYKAAKIGLQKYLDEIEQDKELDREEKTANIDGIKKANANSKKAIVIAVFVPILIAILQIYFDNRKSSITDRDNNSNPRSEINNSQLPLNLTDTAFVEKIKNSLKHDSIFINDIKDLIIDKKK